MRLTDLLEKEIVWRRDPERRAFYFAQVDGTMVEMRLNNFPDEVPCTVFLGVIGPTAGMITEFKPGRTTAGEWQLVRRGQADTSLTSGKVTLPDQAKSIIVWFRFKGNGIKNGSVGLDSLKLEDIGPK